MKCGHLLRFTIAIAAAAPCAAQVVMPTWHSRKGDLPPMIATRAEIEQLVKTVVEHAVVIQPVDTVVHGEPMLSVMGTTTTGRGSASAMPIAVALDTLRRYLGNTSDLDRLFVNYTDARVYLNRGKLLNQARVGSLSIVLSPAASGRSSYSVEGHDHSMVDAAADRIEAFGTAHATWRGPKIGEMARTALKVIALVLLPLALALRDRRGSWLLYPASAALFVASYLFPFALIFSNAGFKG